LPKQEERKEMSRKKNARIRKEAHPAATALGVDWASQRPT